ncbi:MAG: sorbosone dehydrogenase family protein [Chitinophagaceae bacterium]|nr:sorbosone dehydrogenase family protein [Chitinophagaceae bacterium]
MIKISVKVLAVIALQLMVSCGSGESSKKAENAGKTDTITTEASQAVRLPAPYATPSASVNSEVVGWPASKTPKVPEGFSVTRFAAGLKNPRWVYVAANGDVFVAESAKERSLPEKVKKTLSGKSGSGDLVESPNAVLMFRDKDNDGIPEIKTTFLTGLNQPFGMLVLGNSFYVANTDGLMQYPYEPGQTKITAAGKKIIELPAGGYNNHWTRNIMASKDGKKIYITVGSGSNVGENGMEHEVHRAAILEINPDGTGERVYASGLRNPQGMGWAPDAQNTLWTVVNERDGLGDDLVPDYMTSVKNGGFYGWPYAYWGQNEDPRLKDKQRPDLVKKTIVPEVDLGSHTASLGLAFDEQRAFPGKYAGGAFIGQHGSWNSSRLVGYRVAFVPFKDGQPSGGPEPFLTGFIADSASSKVYGRPVGVAFTSGGAMLVTDDAGKTIWRVVARKNG